MSLVDVERLREVAEVEFVDIVVGAIIPDINELRIMLTDGSFVDAASDQHTPTADLPRSSLTRRVRL